MARLERAIREKHNALRVLLDGRIKPCDDSGGRYRFPHTLTYRALFQHSQERSTNFSRVQLDALKRQHQRWGLRCGNGMSDA
jgi:hypothetical protein